MEFGGLKVLMISTDRNILSPGSAVEGRMKEYGQIVDELHIVMMCDAAHALTSKQLDKNVWVYPTSSRLKFLRPRHAARLGAKIVKERKFVRGKSVITTQDPFECGLAGLKVKRRWRLPLEVQLHTDPFSPLFTGFLNSVRKYIARKVFKNVDAVRVVNRGLLERVVSKYHVPADKISVLPIYVDPKPIEAWRTAFDLHARYGWTFVLLAVARLTPEKDLGMAIRALERVRRYYPDTGLVIVGEGPERRKLESLAEELGQHSAVAFAGWEDNLGSYYQTADLFVQTSIYEGYGMALVEAGLSGLPVLTTPVGIAQELESGKDVIVCPQGDSEFLFRSIYDLLGDKNRRDLLKTNLKRTLEKKLMSKETYLSALKANWEKTSTNIPS